jgi:hypothetical protein
LEDLDVSSSCSSPTVALSMTTLLQITVERSWPLCPIDVGLRKLQGVCPFVDERVKVCETLRYLKL